MIDTTKKGKKSVKTNTNAPKKNISIIVEKYLVGISFPVSKNILIQVAKNNGAPDNVIQLLSKIADENYSSVTEIAAEISQAKYDV
jgi:hypothetical protein